MKCIVTNEETNLLTKNKPLSREGRVIIDTKLKEYNSLLKSTYIEEQKKKDTPFTDDFLEKTAPKVTKAFFLRLVSQETLEGAFKKLEEYGKEEVKDEQ